MTKILFVEDNPDSQDMLARRLQKRGYEVICAEDGATGLKLAQTEHPDLILLDLNIPEIDGWEIARQLKSSADTSSIPVIAVTAFSMPGDREQALEAGCDDYASKPVDFHGLHQKINAFLTP